MCVFNVFVFSLFPIPFFYYLSIFFLNLTTKLMQLSDMEETSPIYYIYFKPVRKSY